MPGLGRLFKLFVGSQYWWRFGLEQKESFVSSGVLLEPQKNGSTWGAESLRIYPLNCPFSIHVAPDSTNTITGDAHSAFRIVRFAPIHDHPSTES
jgi:hypothetical protein